MASYHAHISGVQRSKGHNAVASSAYISRSKLVYQTCDKETGVVIDRVHDYSEKNGLEYSSIIAPSNAPSWVYDRELLWNKVEGLDKRKDAETARKIVFALPRELTIEQNIELLKDFANEYLVSEGMIVDMNVHYDKEHNPHAHLQMTTRSLVKLKDGEVVFGLKNQEWGKRKFLYYYREGVSDIINRHLEFHGHLDRVSHLSHKARGIELIPGIHQGPANYIKSAELARLNGEIVKENAAMIRENPELIFQKLSINKPVFTPEDIAKVLDEVLYLGIELPETEAGTKHETVLDQEASIASLKTGDIEKLNATYSTEFMAVYARLLASKNITLINPCDLKGRKLYALTRRVELEQRYAQTVEELADSYRHRLNVNADIIDRSLTEKLTEGIKAFGIDIQQVIKGKTGIMINLVGESRPSLTIEQKQAVIEVLNGSDISVLEGWPGTGKTISMRAIVKQYQRLGYKVLGTAPSSAAALTLSKAAGIDAKNIAQWRKAWQEERKEEFELALRSDFYLEAQYQHKAGALASNTVFIVDEASMVELANMHYLIREVKKSGAKIILVGDNNQFTAVGMTGAFKKAINIVGSSKLTEIMRHQHPDPYIRERQRLATKLVGQYKMPEALSIYRELGVFEIESDAEAAKAALVNDYVEKYLEQAGRLKRDDLASMRSVVIGAYTNLAVNHFNIEVRQRLKQAGVLKGAGAKFLCGQETLELFKGEQIVFETNKKVWQGFNGVLNGEVATVIDFEQPDKHGHGVFTALVHKADGSTQLVKINTAEEKYPVRFKHGYAVTGYKLQGDTVDHMLVYYEPVIGYEAFNVFTSRHRLDVKIYASNAVLEDIVYKRINENPQAAREKFDIIAFATNLQEEGGGKKDGNKEVPNWYVGLALSTSRRVDNNFAIDYLAKAVLSDNELVIKSYLELRESLFELYNKVSSWKERQSHPLKIDSLKQKLSEYFTLGLDEKININPNALILANNSFIKQRAKLGEYITKLANNKGAKVSFSELSKKNKNLAIWHALKGSSKEELESLFEELTQTRKDLKDRAEIICRHYNGRVELGVQNQVASKESELESRYSAIKDNWIKAQRNKLIGEVGEGVLSAIVNEKTFDRSLNVYKRLVQWKVEKLADNKSNGAITIFEAPNELWGIDAWEKWVNQLLLTSKESEISSKTECSIFLTTIKKLEDFEQEKKEALPAIQLLRASLNKSMEGGDSEGSSAQLTMGDELIKLNINYETVQKHASLSIYKYYLEEIKVFGTIGSNSSWQAMMKVCEAIIKAPDNRQDNSKFLPKAEKDKQLLNLKIELKDVNRFIDEVEHDILEKEEGLKASTNEHRTITSEIDKLDNYRESLILEYFSRVYKTPANKVLDKWKSLVESNPQIILSSIAGQVKETPSLLGELKGIGLGKTFGLTQIFSSKGRQEAITLVEVLNQRLEEYEKSGIRLQELKSGLDAGDFINAQAKLVAEIAGLKQLLPNKYEQELIAKLSDLQQSNNFTFEQITKIVISDDGRGLVLDYYNRTGQGQRNSEEQEQSLAKELKQSPVREQAVEGKSAIKLEAANSVGYSAPEERVRRPRVRTRNNVTSDVVRAAQLTFEQVNNALSSSHYERIFRDYAHSINRDGGQIRKQGSRLSCGSLSMNLNNGSWNRFSTGDKGDIYGFIQQARGFDKKEALEFVAIVAGVEGYRNKEYKQVRAGNLEHSNLKQQHQQDIAPDKPLNEWSAVNKVPISAPQFTVSKHLQFMLQEHQCQGTYEYRNVKGELLGYSVRLADKTSGEKQVLPVAWCANAALNKEGWRLKGFNDQGDKPIYGAEKLASNNKPILIVEGEKTADRAQVLLPEYTVISWMGGSGSADKANWSICGGHEVVIWPDNDEVGQKAAIAISSKINSINGHVGMVSIIDPNSLEFKGQVHQGLFEEAWDLADKLPLEVTVSNIREAISSCQKDAVSFVNLKERQQLLEAKATSKSVDIATVSRIYLQERGKSLSPESKIIIERAKIESQWLELLKSDDIKNYRKYAIARGISDSNHEFLNTDNSSMYRATLASIAFNNNINLPTTAEANIPNIQIREVVSRLEEEYERSRQSLYIDESLHENNLTLLAKGSTLKNSAQSELFRILLKDSKLLHQQQMNKPLTPAHQQRIGEEVYKVVKDLTLKKVLIVPDKIKAAELLFAKINSREWWQENLKEQLDIAKKTIGTRAGQKVIGLAPINKLQNQGIERIKESSDPIIATINNLTANNKITDSKEYKILEIQEDNVVEKLIDSVPQSGSNPNLKSLKTPLDPWHSQKHDQKGVETIKLEQNQEQDKIPNKQPVSTVGFSKVQEQIDQELSNPNVTKILTKKIKIASLQKLVQSYAYDRWQTQDQSSLSNNQINSLVSRALFEMKYKTEMQDTADGLWYRDNGTDAMDVASSIKCKVDALRVTKMCGFAIEELVLEHPEKHLEFKDIKNKIIMEGFTENNTRGEMVQDAIEHNEIVKEAASKGKAYQLSIAEQLVDYLLQGGSTAVNKEQINYMNLCASLEQKLIPTLSGQIEEGLQQGFKVLEVDSQQQGCDIASTLDLAIHNIRSNIDNERFRGNDIHGQHQDPHHTTISIEIQTLLNNPDHDHDLHHLSEHLDHHEITRKVINKAIEAQEELRLEKQEQKQEQHLHQSINFNMDM